MPHILVIEEDTTFCCTLSTTLRSAGYDVTHVPTLGAARCAMGLWTPQAIITSLRMCDGRNATSFLLDCAKSVDVSTACIVHDVLRALLPTHAEIPVLMTVDHLTIDLLNRSSAAHIFAYLTEPVETADLLTKVLRACDFKALCDERQSLTEELVCHRAYVKAVFQCVADILITVDAQGRIVSINDTGLGILQANIEDAQGCPWGDVLREWRQQPHDILSKAFESRAFFPRQRISLCLEGGEERDFEITASPLCGEAGKHLGAVLSMRDVTRFVRANVQKSTATLPNLYGLIGHSPSMSRVHHLLQDLASTDTTVLITGESGTGKELVAEGLHNAGPRATGPLVKVNCSALPETLLESELFGHVRGAFTGAVRDRVGRFQLAHGGTIFLDEIGDISPQVQLRLLRVLQEREFERVGDTRTMRVNVRVIAATNRNLRQLVAEGRFREDLYYRLRVVEVELPPLRERLEDIHLLAEHFIGIFNEQFSRSVMRFTEAGMRCLLQYRWPGNVRELRHAVEHGFILCKNNVIDVKDLPNDVQTPQVASSHLYTRSGLDEESLRHALLHSGGNKAKAARSLGVSRQTLYRKMMEFGMEEG